MEGELISYENNQITIGYKESLGFHREAINAPQNKLFVEEVISQYFNKPIITHFIMKGKNQKEPSKDKKEEAIKGVLDFFGEDKVEIK